jgi:ubiquinone biosynthesis protein UbiJ
MLPGKAQSTPSPQNVMPSIENTTALRCKLEESILDVHIANHNIKVNNLNIKARLEDIPRVELEVKALGENLNRLENIKGW